MAQRIGWRLVIAIFLIAAAQLQSATARSISEPGATQQQQQEEGWAALKTDDGILFIWNVKDVHFSLAIKGKEIKPLGDPDHIFFSVDGVVVQVQMAAISEFAKDAKERKLDDKAILAAHRDWESKFLEDLLKAKLTVRNFNVRLTNGADASLWQFDMPAATNSETSKQVYLTTVNHDYVLLLNLAVTNAISEADSRKFLLDTIATMKSSPETIDIQKVADSLRAGTRP
ncbi:MAG TPA: hypothetical protein VLL54_19230 [Pyrinomonadaceae bacterium]|nr:hypothetical protein [Pyrinomonadaceae bacterium]